MIRTAIIAAAGAALVAGIYYGGYKAGSNAVSYKWEIAKVAHANALVAQEARHRATERRLTEEMEAIQDEGRQKLEELAEVLSGVAFERDSVSIALANSRERARQDSAAAGSCEAIQSAADLYAELLTELQGLAGDYAGAADRARLAGAACEVAYGRVR
jgi:predicted house-cleaning noncanonical NTP pyrophosphatase (MazG superfamily)